MNKSKYHQEAGNNSNQFQANTMIVVNGVDEKRAREIIEERTNEIIAYSKEAIKVANQRIQHFEDNLVPKLVKENLLESLADPSIQALLSDAIKSAAVSERTLDTELLSELLIHRINKGENRNVKAGVKKAIEIIDDVSDEALLALTIAHSINYFYPVSGQISNGIGALNNLFSQLLYGRLPYDNQWVDHLDILNAVRKQSFGSFRKLIDYYQIKTPGYFDIGIRKDSVDHKKAIELLVDSNLDSNILFDHELCDGYVRLGIVNINTVDSDSVYITHASEFGHSSFSVINSVLNDNQRKALRCIYDLYEKDENKKKDITEKFVKIWNSYPVLETITTWWNSFDFYFEITSVGKVLAHANAKRISPNLPVLI